MNGDQSAVRLLDVARATGVHVSTVSRVLNRAPDGRVSFETRERILRAADALGYRANALARGLKMSATGALGMFVPTMRNLVFSQFISGAFSRAAEQGFVVLLAEDGDGNVEDRYERLVEEGRVDGLIIASSHLGGSLLVRLTERHVPHVFANRRQPDSGRNVFMEEEEAGRMGAEHLIGLGHSEISMLAGPRDVDTAQRRADGFIEATAAAGIRPQVLRSAYDESEAFAKMKTLLELNPRPTGLLVSNFNQAIGVMAGLRAAGVRIPEDISVVTCDDDPVFDYLAVPITGIRMPLAELGAAAVDALISQIRQEPPHDMCVDIPPQLVPRQSSAPATTFPNGT